MLQVSWMIMIKNDKKVNGNVLGFTDNNDKKMVKKYGNVSGFVDPESHAPNRALQWQRHLYLRLQGL